MRRLTVALHNQRLAIAALVVIPLWIGVPWLGLPLWHRLKQVNRQVPTARQRLAHLQELAARQPQVEQAYRASARFWAEGSDELLQQAFLDDVEQLAAEGAMSLNLKPRPIQRDGSVRRLGMELEVETTQEGLLAFLDRLFAHPSLLELERLQLSAVPSPESPLRATLVVNKVLIPPPAGSPQASQPQKEESIGPVPRPLASGCSPRDPEQGRGTGRRQVGG